jgi:hypothetical protein
MGIVSPDFCSVLAAVLELVVVPTLAAPVWVVLFALSCIGAFVPSFAMPAWVSFFAASGQSAIADVIAIAEMAAATKIEAIGFISISSIGALRRNRFMKGKFLSFAANGVDKSIPLWGFD